MDTFLTLNEFMSALLVFFFCLLGVITKDYMDTITGKDTKVYYFRIVIITFIITVLMLSIREIILFLVGNNKYLFAFICISMGWANYQVYQLLTWTANTIMRFFKKQTTGNLGLDEGLRKDMQTIAEELRQRQKSKEQEDDDVNIK